MKVMFLDETGDHSLESKHIDRSYPMFALAGCIFDFDMYLSTVESDLNVLKQDHFGRTDIIIRSYDIRKQKGDFAGLVDYEKRMAFYEAINQFISAHEFTVIAAAINKLDLVDQYHDPANPYSLCLRFILERAVMYLGRSEEVMIIRAESRENHNDRELAKVYEQFRQHGNGTFIDGPEVMRKLVDLSFNQKTQNVAGHQIADLVAYPIGRWVLDREKENKAFEIVEPKLHRKGSNYLNYGLKIFP